MFIAYALICKYWTFGFPNDRLLQTTFSLQDYELIRVFDSLEFEDECEEGVSMTLQSHGSLNEEQTRQMM